MTGRPRGLIVASWSCLLLGACAAGSAPSPPVERHEVAGIRRAYADEPYEVRVVDRSKFDVRFHPTIVPAPPVDLPVGSILIDTRERFLYLIKADGMARRYGVAVGAAGRAWSGTATIGRMATWPAWYPTDGMRRDAPGLPWRVEPGPHNPLGARALYLYRHGRDTLYRIHGTSEPWTIGTEASSGCIRMLNEDVIDLYDRVSVGALVKVI